MSHTLNESVDSFIVSFGGASKIDAELFTKTINNTIALVKASANAIDPDSFLRLEIRANKEGSFETIIDAVARHIPNLFTKDNVMLACEIVGGFLAFLKIKQHLIGLNPQKIKSIENNKSEIINQENAVLVVDSRISNAFFSNSTIDNSITNVFIDLSEGKRKSFAVKGDKSEFYIKQEDFEIMTCQMTGMENDGAQKIISSQALKNCELTIKKADLLGNSKWDFILNKKISVKIDDEDFLCKIRDGSLKISGGYKLVCDLEIKTEMDKDYEVTNVEYFLIKVHSIKDREKQLELFT